MGRKEEKGKEVGTLTSIVFVLDGLSMLEGGGVL